MRLSSPPAQHLGALCVLRREVGALVGVLRRGRALGSAQAFSYYSTTVCRRRTSIDSRSRRTRVTRLRFAVYANGSRASASVLLVPWRRCECSASVFRLGAFACAVRRRWPVAALALLGSFECLLPFTNGRVSQARFLAVCEMKDTLSLAQCMCSPSSCALCSTSSSSFPSSPPAPYL